MSRYQSSSTRLALTNFVQAQWQESAAVGLCSSAELTALAEQLISPSLSIGGEAPPMLAAARLLADPRLAGLAQAADPSTQARLGEVRALVPAGPSALTAAMGSCHRTGGEPPAELPAAAAAVFTNLVPVLARQERVVVADTAVDALSSLGYTVIHESGPHADGIEARRGNELMLLAITDGGEISTDHLGADGACSDRQIRFETAMADRGVIMTSHAVDTHEDDIGPLIRAAATAGEASLALAVARHTASKPRSAARTRRTGANQGRNQRRTRALQREDER